MLVKILEQASSVFWRKNYCICWFELKLLSVSTHFNYKLSKLFTIKPIQTINFYRAHNPQPTLSQGLTTQTKGMITRTTRVSMITIMNVPTIPPMCLTARETLTQTLDKAQSLSLEGCLMQDSHYHKLCQTHCFGNGTKHQGTKKDLWDWEPTRISKILLGARWVHQL